MAEEIKTPMSDFDEVSAVKDTAEFILLQDGKNARVYTPIFEQKILDKTNGRYLGKTEKGAPNGIASLDENKKIPNENLTFGEIKSGDANVVSGGDVFKEINPLKIANYVKHSEVLNELDITSKNPVNSYAVKREDDNIRNMIDTQNGASLFFISEWDTTKTSAGSSASNQVQLPLVGTNYDLSVSWGDGTTSNVKHGINYKDTSTTQNYLLNSELQQVRSEGYLDIPLSEPIQGDIWISVGGIEVIEGAVQDKYLGVLLGKDKETINNSVNLKDSTYYTISKDAYFLRVYSSDTLAVARNVFVDFSKIMVTKSKTAVAWKPNYKDLQPLHTYREEGVYIVSIKGKTTSFSFGNTNDKLKILQVLNWGEFDINTGGIFNGCSNLKLSNSIGTPRLTYNSLVSLFRLTNVRNIGNLKRLNLSRVKEINFMFEACYDFDGVGLELWDYRTINNGEAFMKYNKGMSSEQYGKILKAMSQQVLRKGWSIDFGNVKYNAADKKYRDVLTSTYNITITDGGQK